MLYRTVVSTSDLRNGKWLQDFIRTASIMPVLANDDLPPIIHHILVPGTSAWRMEISALNRSLVRWCQCGITRLPDPASKVISVGVF